MPASSNYTQYLIVSIGSGEGYCHLGDEANACILKLTGEMPLCTQHISIKTNWNGEQGSQERDTLSLTHQLNELSSKFSRPGDYAGVQSVFVILSGFLSSKFVTSGKALLEERLQTYPDPVISGEDVFSQSQENNPGIATSENPQSKGSQLKRTSEQSKSSWESLFDFLTLVGKRGRGVLFIRDAPPIFSFRKPNGLSIERVDTIQEMRDYILTRIGRDLFRFNFRVNDQFGDGITKYVSKVRNDSECDLVDTEYHDWFAQEFGKFSIGESFLQNCMISLCGIKDIKQHDLKRTLPWQMQIAIGVSRMCRRMSTWTLEGTPFECTVVLVRQSVNKIASDNQFRMRSIIDLEACPFNFSNEDRVRQFAEMAQGLPLLMVVSATDGCLHFIGSSAAPDNRVLLHRHFRELASDSAVVFRVRPQGRVDMFTKDGLQLSFDGFQWRENPFAGLENAIREHFGQRKDIQHKCLEKLREATQQLLDASNSSIFVLVHPDDEVAANSVSGESLRAEIALPPSIVRLKIDELDANALSSFLHLDGAHFINSDGQVYAVARRIPSLGKARHTIVLDETTAIQLKEKSQFLPAGAEVTSDRFAGNWQLRFPKRIQINWIDEWKNQSPQMFDDSVLEKIENVVCGQHSGLFSFAKILFSDIPTAVQLQELQKALLEIGFESERCASHSDIKLNKPQRSGLIVWKKDRLSDVPIDNPAVFKIGQPEKDKIVKVCVDLGRVDGMFESNDPWFFVGNGRVSSEHLASLSQILGFAVLATGLFLVMESLFENVLADPRLPYPIFQIMDHWHRYGNASHDDNPGTGTRAAKDLSTSLPKSWVVKVSASGKIKIWKNGDDHSAQPLN